MINKTQKNRSIIWIFLLFFSSTLILFVLAFSCLWLWEKIHSFENESFKIREEYMLSQENMLQHEVEDVIKYIQYMKTQTEKRIRQDVKARTNEAYNIANHIYQLHKKNKSLDDIKKIVYDALYPASWDNGDGYYFAINMKGTERMNRNSSELNKINLWDIQDVKGNFIMHDIVQKSGEGFIAYDWNKPGNSETQVPKISYVKYFKPFGWMIGNGKYLDDEENLIKKEILERIENIHFGDNNYIFVGNWDGVSLIDPFANKNMFDVQDSNGVYLVRELIEVAKDGGGFVNYVMPKFKGVPPQPKISYANGIADWKWYVGAGVYVDAIEEMIAQRQIDFQKQVFKYFGRTMLLFAVLLIFAIYMAWMMSGKMKAQIDIFGTFFKDAAARAVNINLNRLDYLEFQTLAESANEMILLRHNALIELEASEKHFIQMVELAPIPILITGTDGHPEYINKQFEETFGYCLEDMPDISTWMQWVYPDSVCQNEVKEILAKKIDVKSVEGSVYETDIIKVISADNKTLLIRFYRTMVGDRELTLAYDYTDMINSEQERTSLLRQLHQAQKMEAIGMMAGGVAHDLNNILSGIVSYPEILLMQLPEDSKLRKPLESIHESGLRAAGVVSDLLTVARGVASEKMVRNLNVMTEEYLASPELYELKSRFPKVTINMTYADTLLNIICSEIHVKKALMNLIINAVEAVGEDGLVVVKTYNCHMEKCILNNQSLEEGDYVVVTVGDDGLGISSKDLEHIFEPFYSKKIKGYSGTGLGLPIVWNTMLDHKGAVNIVSGDWGSRFELYFPATQEFLFDDRDDKDGNKLLGNGEHILIVDDEAQQRDIASLILKSLNYNVQMAASGEEAVAMLKDMSFDLLVLDMIMEPGISGRETYEQIVIVHPNQKALIVSGFSNNLDVSDIQKLGAGQFLKKPYTLEQLGISVKNALK